MKISVQDLMVIMDTLWDSVHVEAADAENPWSKGTREDLFNRLNDFSRNTNLIVDVEPPLGESA
jgi:hypothetical protein